VGFPNIPAYAPPSQPADNFEHSAKRRWFELFLVTFTAFSGPLIRAISYFRHGSATTSQFDNLRYLQNIFHEAGVLLLLAYILWRSRRSFRDIGFRWSFTDASIGILVLIASYVVYPIGAGLSLWCTASASAAFRGT